MANIKNITEDPKKTNGYPEIKIKGMTIKKRQKTSIASETLLKNKISSLVFFCQLDSDLSKVIFQSLTSV